MTSASLMRLHTSINVLLKGQKHLAFLAVWDMCGTLKRPEDPLAEWGSDQLHSFLIEWLACSPLSSANSSQTRMWTCSAMARKEGLWVERQKWRVHRRLRSSDSCSQSKAGLGKAYGKDVLIKMGKKAVGMQEGRKELIYDEAKAADLKEIIILL